MNHPSVHETETYIILHSVIYLQMKFLQSIPGDSQDRIRLSRLRLQIQFPVFQQSIFRFGLKKNGQRATALGIDEKNLIREGGVENLIMTNLISRLKNFVYFL